MKRVERLGEAVAPDGSVLTLYRHDRDYSIRVDGEELMSTRRHHSEDVLAELVCAPLRERGGARVLIGGLGLGFTLRAALRTLAPDAQAVVAEIMEAVIRWNRNPDYALAADALADPRVDLRHDDVADVLGASPGAFDAIMLDVDNGAAPMTTRGNAGLYRAQGIRRAVAALRPGGRVAYWSAGGDPAFEAALRREKLTVEAVRVRAHPSLKSWHTIFVAHRADVPADAKSGRAMEPDDRADVSADAKSGRVTESDDRADVSAHAKSGRVTESGNRADVPTDANTGGASEADERADLSFRTRNE